jgi:glutathione synthase/RimK-type ligase-like ATP-grasp enzyme
MPVLLATCAALPDGDEDAEVLTAALAARGVEADWAVWSDRAVRWDAGPVIVRSTWDYTADRAAFLTWIESVPRVDNPAPVVRWNTDKVYLADLAAAGVATVPTFIAPPGRDVELPDAEMVVKPSVGAGSRGAGRFRRGQADAARAHAASLHADGRTVLVQPYLDAVDSAGETALIYFAGRFSHAIRKGPMLPVGAAHPMDGEALYVPELIEPRQPDPAELAVGDATLAAVRDRFGADLLYARVDLLPSADGPVVVELELTEPSLFLQDAGDVDAAGAFAQAIADFLAVAAPSDVRA